jgi:multiple antibiotic resistance protein
VLDDYTLFITQLVTLWAVLDPIGHLPLFLGATGSLDDMGRRRAAIVSVLVAFSILAVFSLAGQFMLHAMGISLLSFQIAGGIILLLFAITMIQGGANPAAAGGIAGDTALSLALYPIATPIIAGPGALLTIVLLMDNNRYSLAQQAITIVALALVLAVLLGVFLLGNPIRRLIGTGGTHVLRRVMGLILAALAVNMILSALALWLHLPPI